MKKPSSQQSRMTEYIKITKRDEMRCSWEDCGGEKGKPRLFFIGELGIGSKIEVKCTRCKRISKFEKIA